MSGKSGVLLQTFDDPLETCRDLLETFVGISKHISLHVYQHLVTFLESFGDLVEAFDNLLVNIW